MEGIKDSHLCYYAIFNNQVNFRNFWRPIAQKEKFFEVYYHQMPEALADSLVACTGRGLGKSTGLEMWFLGKMLSMRICEMMLTAFRAIHVRDRMESIIGMFYKIPYFRHFLIDKYPVRRSPMYEVKLKSGVIAYGIAIGDDPQAVNMTGKHASVRAIEECQFYPSFAFIQFQGAKAQTGSVDRMIGVADGMVDSVFRNLDNDESLNRLHLTRRYNPDFTSADLKELAKNMGGEGSGDFQNQVDSLWGEPVSSAWDLEAIKGCMILDRKHPDYSSYVVSIRRKQFEAAHEEPGAFLYNLPMKGEAVRYFICIDVGYSQPTVITIYADYGGTFQLLARINLRDRMPTPQQEAIIKFIFKEYESHSQTLISIDTTDGEGRGMADHLVKDIDVSRLYRVEFQSNDVVRVDPDGTEHKETLKELTAMTLKDIFQTRVKGEPMITMPYDSEILEEFGAERRQRDTFGNSRLITPNNVHIPESMRCFSYLYWLFFKKDMGPGNDQSGDFALPIVTDTPEILRSA